MINTEKAIACNAYCSTNKGLKKVQDLKVGDSILIPGSENSIIDAVTDAYLTDLFRVVLEDGREILTTGSFTWKGYSDNKEPIVFSTEDITGEEGYYVSIPGPLKYSSKTTSKTISKISPYCYGLLVGCSTMGSHVTHKYKKALDSIAELGASLKFSLESTNIPNTYTLKNKTGEELFPLHDLFPIRLDERCLPDDLLYVSIEDRLECLKGLIDTLGYIPKKEGAFVTISTLSKPLITQVTELVRGLGGVCSVQVSPHCSYIAPQEMYEDADMYVATIKMPKELGAISNLPAYISKLNKDDKVPNMLKITQVIPAGTGLARAFSVEDGNCVVQNIIIHTEEGE